MKNTCMFFVMIFLLISCNQDTQKNIISQELENQNVIDDTSAQKTKSIRLDFEKDLDTFFQENAPSD